MKIAASVSPDDANTWYYLGCDEWNHDRKNDAIADWKKAVVTLAARAKTIEFLDGMI